MKTIFLVIFLVSLTVLFGCSTQQQNTKKNAIDTAQYFTYPNTEFVIISGETKSTMMPAKNHSIPQHPGEKPIFRSGTGEAGFPRIEYEFMGRCDVGDVYVFYVKQGDTNEITKKVVPFVYSGNETTVIDEKDVKLTVRPKKTED